MITLEVQYHRTSDPNWSVAKKFTVLNTDRTDYLSYCGYILASDCIGCTYTYPNACQHISTPRDSWRRTEHILFHYVEIKEGRTVLK